MCGRFSLTTELDVLLERFQIEQTSIEEYVPRFNIAPTQQIAAVIRADQVNRLGTLRWGLIPFWAKDPSISNKLINARSETADQKASFKHALEKRRCLILSDGFYEWKRTKNRKIPMRIQVRNGEPFAMAGLWEKWNDSNSTIYTCTILTTEANELMKEIHNRMPVILTREAEAIWLDSSINDLNKLKNCMHSFPSAEMNAYEVSTLVNSPKNEKAECILPVN
ncbi:SOS response-associated peptidase [Pseudalkalibacillus hwajinpoensis]|uniref:SOS response-associated peptidase n=1 Tax=Guptibacillus hwajinpoensis TaxID=208199 RepID=UPI001CFCDCD4|nr:SOS response-associated peptidase [Pseudalkalibacillus hwajinpoensis]